MDTKANEGVLARLLRVPKFAKMLDEAERAELSDRETRRKSAAAAIVALEAEDAADGQAAASKIAELTQTIDSLRERLRNLEETRADAERTRLGASHRLDRQQEAHRSVLRELADPECVSVAEEVCAMIERAQEYSCATQQTMDALFALRNKARALPEEYHEDLPSVLGKLRADLAALEPATRRERAIAVPTHRM